MRNKKIRLIICGLLAAVICVTASGCSLFEHNYEKDYNQVVATVSPITFTSKASGTQKTYTSEEVNIYKRQLIVQWNNSAANYMNVGYSAEDTAEALLSQLINRELLVIEAKKLLAFDEMTFTQADKNAVTQSVYETLDDQIKTLTNDVLRDHNDPTPSEATNEENKTTYPVKGTEEPDEEDPATVEKWVPDKDSYLAVSGDIDKLSLEREVVRRLVDWLAGLVKDDKLATDTEKKYFDKDVEKMKNLIAQGKEHEVYPMLYDFDYDPEKGTGNGTYLVSYLMGDSAYDNRLLTKLQEYVEKGVSVTKAEVLDEYNRLVDEQKRDYASQSKYHEAMTSDTTDVVYNPDDNHFYVKHILIPFSDAQTKALEDYKKTGLYSAEEIEKFRANLAKEIVGYPHVDGENDLSRPMSIDAIFGDIRSQMSRYANDPVQAERLFDDLVYKYSTDSGSVGSLKGYAVRYKLPAGESETYMKEFSAAARDMYDTLKVGQLYKTPVVTDYGVHIMYLASKTTAGVKAITDYQTNAQYKTIQTAIEEKLLSAKKSSVYSDWQKDKIAFYTDSKDPAYIERFTDRYKDIYQA